MNKAKLKLILPAEKVNDAIGNIASAIHEIGSPFTFIVILKGGIYTALKILEVFDGWFEASVSGDIVVGFIGLSSYEKGTKSQGFVRVMSPLDLSAEYIKDRNVIIVDDCIETGNTLYWAKKMISIYDPKSIHTAVLVDKVTLRERCRMERPDIVGYEYTGEKFLVGAGMGFDERYRGISEVYEVESEVENDS